MKRRLLLLTEAEIGTLRAAVVTADSEDCGAMIHRRYEAALVALHDAPVVTLDQWQTLKDAADDLLAGEESEANDVLGRGAVARCQAFIDAMTKAFRPRRGATQ